MRSGLDESHEEGARWRDFGWLDVKKNKLGGTEDLRIDQRMEKDAGGSARPSDGGESG